MSTNSHAALRAQIASLRKCRVQADLQPLLPPLLDLARELSLQVPLGVSHSRRVVSKEADVAVDLSHTSQLL